MCLFQNSRVRKVFTMLCPKYTKSAMRKKEIFKGLPELYEMSGN